MAWLISILYAWAMRLRAGLYRRGWLRARQLKHPVISVGNLTLGGTGKTPFVAYLARLLQEAGHQPIILSRGYRGSAEREGCLVSDGNRILADALEAGDEPFLLARKLPRVPVVVGRDRYRAGRRVEDGFERAIFLLDDGFQHLQLKRNLDILLIDGSDPWGLGKVLPAGRLREPVSALERADLVVITRAHLAIEAEEIENRVRRHHPTVPISFFSHDAVAVTDLRSGESFGLRDFYNQPVVALAAIGNPKLFLSDLAHYQMRLVGQFLFRDHHRFQQPELDQALETARAGRARGVVTTEKDGVRLESLRFQEGEIFTLQIEPHAEDDQEYRRFLLNEVENLLPPK